MEKSMRNLTREQNIRVWAAELATAHFGMVAIDKSNIEDVLEVARRLEHYVLDTPATEVAVED